MTAPISCPRCGPSTPSMQYVQDEGRYFCGNCSHWSDPVQTQAPSPDPRNPACVTCGQPTRLDMSRKQFYCDLCGKYLGEGAAEAIAKHKQKQANKLGAGAWIGILVVVLGAGGFVAWQILKEKSAPSARAAKTSPKGILSIPGASCFGNTLATVKKDNPGARVVVKPQEMRYLNHKVAYDTSIETGRCTVGFLRGMTYLPSYRATECKYLFFNNNKCVGYNVFPGIWVDKEGNAKEIGKDDKGVHHGMVYKLKQLLSKPLAKLNVLKTKREVRAQFRFVWLYIETKSHRVGFKLINLSKTGTAPKDLEEYFVLMYQVLEKPKGS